MRNNKGDIQPGVLSEAHSPSFKPWMRVIAFVVLFCFVHQDMVSAMGGNYSATLDSMFLRPIEPLIQHPTGLMAYFSPERVYASILISLQLWVMILLLVV